MIRGHVIDAYLIISIQIVFVISNQRMKQINNNDMSHFNSWFNNCFQAAKIFDVLEVIFKTLDFDTSNSGFSTDSRIFRSRG